MAKKQSSKTSNLIRLNKFIADKGLASRRKADELIDEGLVKLNGKTVYEMGTKIDPSKDKISVKGKAVNNLDLKKVYYMFNKPKKVVTSLDDPFERLSVADYFKKIKFRLFPAGRLDWDTEGLLIMTNDGEFSQEIMSPNSQISKTYIAKIDGIPSQNQLNKLLRGVSIIGGKVRAKKVERIKRGTSDKYTWVKIVITEGKNHQVKKMFYKIGFDVLKLQRTAIGKLYLGNLKIGSFQELSALDLTKIFSK